MDINADGLSDENVNDFNDGDDVAQEFQKIFVRSSAQHEVTARPATPEPGSRRQSEIPVTTSCQFSLDPEENRIFDWADETEYEDETILETYNQLQDTRSQSQALSQSQPGRAQEEEAPDQLAESEETGESSDDLYSDYVDIHLEQPESDASRSAEIKEYFNIHPKSFRQSDYVTLYVPEIDEEGSPHPYWYTKYEHRSSSERDMIRRDINLNTGRPQKRKKRPRVVRSTGSVNRDVSTYRTQITSPLHNGLNASDMSGLESMDVSTLWDEMEKATQKLELIESELLLIFGTSQARKIRLWYNSWILQSRDIDRTRDELQEVKERWRSAYKRVAQFEYFMETTFNTLDFDDVDQAYNGALNEADYQREEADQQRERTYEQEARAERYKSHVQASIDEAAMQHDKAKHLQDSLDGLMETLYSNLEAMTDQMPELTGNPVEDVHILLEAVRNRILSDRRMIDAKCTEARSHVQRILEARERFKAAEKRRQERMAATDRVFQRMKDILGPRKDRDETQQKPIEKQSEGVVETAEPARQTEEGSSCPASHENNQNQGEA